MYADGFFGKNEDYSEDLNRIEIDIIKAIQGGCNKRELKTNDATKESFIQRLQITIAFSTAFRVIFQVLDKSLLKTFVIK